MMAFFDLNPKTSRRHTSGSHQKGMAHELREDGVCPAYGFSAHIRIPSVRGAVRRRVQGQDLLLLGPVSFHGLCPTHLSRKPAGHRGLSPCSRTEALPHGDTGKGVPEYACKRQPGSGLAYLRGFRPDPHRKGAETLRPRLLRGLSGPHRLCARFDHHRPLSVPLPLGGVQKPQRGGQAPHASRS